MLAPCKYISAALFEALGFGCSVYMWRLLYVYHFILSASLLCALRTLDVNNICCFKKKKRFNSK